MIGALWAFLEQRTWLAALCGALAMYSKIDLAFLYPGVAGLTWLLQLRSERPLPARHVLLAIGIPVLALAPWVLLIYGIIGRPTTVGGGAQPDIFLTLVPQMLEQMFTLPLTLAMVMLLFLLAPAVLAVVRSGAGMAMTMLGVWMALSLVVLLVYSALPGASNNPRVFIPALPALCILTAAGGMRLGHRLRLVMLTVIFTVFVIVNVVGVVYQVLQARVTSAAMPVWSVLRDAPPGVILTESVLAAALYARQPATWFEHDPVFQRNIMHNATHFRRYLAGAPILATSCCRVIRMLRQSVWHRQKRNGTPHCLLDGILVGVQSRWRLMMYAHTWMQPIRSG